MQQSRDRRTTAAILAVAAALAAMPAAADAKGSPDLSVSSGSLKLAGGKVSGVFTIRNVSRSVGVKATAAKLELVLPHGRRPLVKSFGVPKLARLKSKRHATAGSFKRFNVSSALPKGLPAGKYNLQVCADSAKKVREHSEGNNCRIVGSVTIAGATTPAGGTSPTGPGPIGNVPSVPAAPFAYAANTVIAPGAGRDYWTYVPSSYNPNNQTPITLLVWLHGCYGRSSSDIPHIGPGGPGNYITIAPDGREYNDPANDPTHYDASRPVSDGCFDPAGDQGRILADIANIKTHFNIDPHRVVLGGYSGGGDTAYRMAFYNSTRFAGLLAINTSPFRDTGSSQAQSLAAATRKFPIVHVAHTDDGVYGIAGVKAETDAVKAAGFPLTFIERPGHHYDPDDGLAIGTYYDINTYLLPHLSDGWYAP